MITWQRNRSGRSFEGRLQRAMLNYASTLLFTVATVCQALVATPFLLWWLGVEEFGALRALTDWMAYLSLLPLGVLGGLSPLLAQSLARNDTRNLHGIMAAGVKALLVLAFVTLLCGAVLATAIPKLIPVEPRLLSDLKMAGWVSVPFVFLVVLLPFRILTEARQQTFVINLFLLLQALTSIAAALFLAWAGWGISGQVFAASISAIVFLVMVCAYEWHHVTHVMRLLFQVRTDPQHWSAIWALSGPTVLRQLCGRLSVLSDNIIVAALIGPAAVAPFFLSQRLPSLAMGQLQGLGSASWAAFSELYHTGHHEIFNRRLVELIRVVSVLSVAVLVPIAAYNGHFVRRWVGTELYAGDLVTAVAVVNAFLLAVVTTADMAIGCTGHVRKLATISVIATSINLSLSLALTPRFGVLGPLLGTLVSILATHLWYVPRLLHRLFGTPVPDLARAVGIPLLSAYPYATIVWSVSRCHEPAGWLGLAAEMGTATIAYLAVAWGLIFTLEERQTWVARTRRICGTA